MFNIHHITRKIRTVSLFLLLLPVLASGQVVISTGGGWKAFETVNIELSIVDKDSQEPLCGASAYLQADTLITHFTISSEKGVIAFTDVPKGKYRLNIELLGYIPYREEFSIMKASDVPHIIGLEIDTIFLDAASITDYSTPVFQVHDTLVYNASAVQVGQNAVLEDLVKKMPGMEISNGQVVVNGVPVKTITVGGKTFFFSDPSLAIKNLPARIVEKIRVYDRVSFETESVETALGKKDERVMDIEVKDEFKKGSFGNLSLLGGSGSTQSINTSDPKTKALFDARLVSSAYNEKNQVVALATSNNLSPADGMNGKLAVNINTSKIKNTDNTIAIIGSYDKKSEDQSVFRNYYSSSSNDLHSTENTIGQTGVTALDINLESRVKGNCNLIIKPMFNYQRGNYFRDGYKIVSSADDESVSHLSQTGHNSSLSYGLSLQGRIDSLGRHGRRVQFKLSGNKTDAGDIRSEIASLPLDYVISKSKWAAAASFVYTEPISSVLEFNITGDADFSAADNIVTATNKETGMINSSYSSNSKTHQFSSTEAAFFTLKVKEYSASIGGKLLQDMNRNTWGEDGARNKKWRFGISPFLNIESFDGSQQLFVLAQSTPVQETQMLPSLTRVGSAEYLIGNPYLQPSTSFSAVVNYYKTRQIQFLCEIRVDSNPIVNATWLSPDGRRNSFPVNSRHPQIMLSPFINYYLYLTKDKRCYFYFNINGAIHFEKGYQATTGPEISEDTFSFPVFIEKCWGGEEGDIFYNGFSGFRESQTFICDLNSLLSFTYRNKTITSTLNFSPAYYKSRYSLIPKANEDVWRLRVGPTLDWRLPRDYSLSSKLEYILYKGFGEGFDRDQWDLSFELSKDIGAFALSIKCQDALNQNVRLSRTASSEYVQNSIQNCMGRMVLFSVGYLFGKGSAEKQRNSSQFVRKLTR